MQIARRSEQVSELVDGFALVSVSGLTLLVILPSALHVGGLPTALFVAFGMGLPTFLHRLGSQTLALTADRALILGVAIHAAIECAALAGADEHFGFAVVAHRVPVGLAVFMLAASPQSGWRFIGFLALASLVGFTGGQELVGLLNDHQHAWLEGFVAGSLLHVVQGHALGHDHDHRQVPAPGPTAASGPANHRPGRPAAVGTDTAPLSATPAAATAALNADAHHCASHGDDGHTHEITRGSLLGGIGSLLGIVLVLAVLFDPHEHYDSLDHEAEVLAPAFIDTFLDLALTSAPALLLGYLLAGLVRALMTTRQVSWLAGGRRSTQAVKGVAFGLPLPICSCGVLPLYQSLVRAGVPVTASVAFLIATPELGIDALLLSLPLLGETLTLLRLLAALFVALAVALLLGALHRPHTPLPSSERVIGRPPLGTRLRKGLSFGLVELFDHTMPWIVLGLVIAALLAPLLDTSTLATLPPALQVPLFALLSVPAYVCAAGATPIAAVAIQGGISPGAALAFLIAGPATNVTTFGILTQLHGRRFALSFGIAVAACAIAVGWLVDLSGWVEPGSPTVHTHADERLPEILALSALGLLAALSLLRQGPRGMVQQITTPFRSAGSQEAS